MEHSSPDLQHINDCCTDHAERLDDQERRIRELGTELDKRTSKHFGGSVSTLDDNPGHDGWLQQHEKSIATLEKHLSKLNNDLTARIRKLEDNDTALRAIGEIEEDVAELQRAVNKAADRYVDQITQAHLDALEQRMSKRMDDQDKRHNNLVDRLSNLTMRHMEHVDSTYKAGIRERFGAWLAPKLIKAAERTERVADRL